MWECSYIVWSQTFRRYVKVLCHEAAITTHQNARCHKAEYHNMERHCKRELKFLNVLLTYIPKSSWSFVSQYLTNLMHKICFTISCISCLYMFRVHVLEACRGMKLNLFWNKFCASSLLNTEINILRCTISKTWKLHEVYTYIVRNTAVVMVLISTQNYIH